MDNRKTPGPQPAIPLRPESKGISAPPHSTEAKVISASSAEEKQSIPLKDKIQTLNDIKHWLRLSEQFKDEKDFKELRENLKKNRQVIRNQLKVLAELKLPEKPKAKISPIAEINETKASLNQKIDDIITSLGNAAENYYDEILRDSSLTLSRRNNFNEIFAGVAKIDEAGNFFRLDNPRKKNPKGEWSEIKEDKEKIKSSFQDKNAQFAIRIEALDGIYKQIITTSKKHSGRKTIRTFTSLIKETKNLSDVKIENPDNVSTAKITLTGLYDAARRLSEKIASQQEDMVTVEKAFVKAQDDIHAIKTQASTILDSVSEQTKPMLANLKEKTHAAILKKYGELKQNYNQHLEQYKKSINEFDHNIDTTLRKIKEIGEEKQSLSTIREKLLSIPNPNPNIDRLIPTEEKEEKVKTPIENLLDKINELENARNKALGYLVQHSAFLKDNEIKAFKDDNKLFKKKNAAYIIIRTEELAETLETAIAKIDEKIKAENEAMERQRLEKEKQEAEERKRLEARDTAEWELVRRSSSIDESKSRVARSIGSSPPIQPPSSAPPALNLAEAARSGARTSPHPRREATPSPQKDEVRHSPALRPKPIITAWESHLSIENKRADEATDSKSRTEIFKKDTFLGIGSETLIKKEHLIKLVDKDEKGSAQDFFRRLALGLKLFGDKYLIDYPASKGFHQNQEFAQTLQYWGKKWLQEETKIIVDAKKFGEILQFLQLIKDKLDELAAKGEQSKGQLALIIDSYYAVAKTKAEQFFPTITRSREVSNPINIPGRPGPGSQSPTLFASGSGQASSVSNASVARSTTPATTTEPESPPPSPKPKSGAGPGPGSGNTG